METVWAQIVTLLTDNQQAIVIALSAFLVSAAAKQWPAFAGFGDWGKRAVLFVVAIGVSFVVSLIGGIPDIDIVALLVGGGFAAASAGTTFKIARTTPTTELASELRKEGK